MVRGRAVRGIARLPGPPPGHTAKNCGLDINGQKERRQQMGWTTLDDEVIATWALAVWLAHDDDVHTSCGSTHARGREQCNEGVPASVFPASRMRVYRTRGHVC